MADTQGKLEATLRIPVEIAYQAGGSNQTNDVPNHPASLSAQEIADWATLEDHASSGQNPGVERMLTLSRYRTGGQEPASAKQLMELMRIIDGLLSDHADRMAELSRDAKNPNWVDLERFIVSEVLGLKKYIDGKVSAVQDTIRSSLTNLSDQLMLVDLRLRDMIDSAAKKKTRHPKASTKKKGKAKKKLKFEKETRHA